MSSKSSWESTALFYEDLIVKGHDLTGLLILVNRIMESSLSERVFGFTSHFDLCLSRGGTYADRLGLPMVSIQQIDKEKFKLLFYRSYAKTHDIRTRECSSNDIWTEIEAAVEQL